MTFLTAPHTCLWPEVEPGFWVSNIGGNFGGTVERTGGGFLARDAMGVAVGTFPDAASAKRAVEERFRVSIDSAR